MLMLFFFLCFFQRNLSTLFLTFLIFSFPTFQKREHERYLLPPFFQTFSELWAQEHVGNKDAINCNCERRETQLGMSGWATIRSNRKVGTKKLPPLGTPSENFGRNPRCRPARPNGSPDACVSQTDTKYSHRCRISRGTRHP